MQNTDARDGPGLKMLTHELDTDAHLLFLTTICLTLGTTRRAEGSNQIKWALQKVGESFLVLFAFEMHFNFPCLWCLHREPTISLFTSLQQTKGYLFIGFKNMKHQNCYDYIIHRTNFLEKIWTHLDLYVCNKCAQCHKRSKRILKILKSNTLNGKYSYSWFLWSHKNLSYYDGHF